MREPVVTIFFAALAILVESRSRSLRGVQYEIKPRYYADPEPKIRQDLKLKTDKFYWWKFTDHARYVGLLYAGRTEFNWIVDLRNEDGHQEQWAIGNLITSRHVLTTCRAFKFLSRSQQSTPISIHYCTVYLWEDFVQYNLEGFTVYDIRDPENAGGKRWAINVIKHPQCTPGEMGYDAGVITMNRGINPYTPYVGFMPVARNSQTNQIINTVDLSRMSNQRRMCYVASFGRSYNNVLQHRVLNYKVKLRVYYAEWATCSDFFHMICKSGDAACSKKPEVYGRSAASTMCFESRAKVGSICDHDRGAPLVCDGEVYGLVTRGAMFDYCNNLLHLPFLVLKLDQLKDYYAGIQKAAKEMPRYDYGPYERSGAASLTLTFKIGSSVLCFLITSSH